MAKGVCLTYFGVKSLILASSEELLASAVKVLTEFFPGPVLLSEDEHGAFEFEIAELEDGTVRLRTPFGVSEFEQWTQSARRAFRSYFRAVVAANAPEHLFLHAGCVKFQGRLFIFPGDSHSGKSTLVKEFLMNSAEYFSDEYAVLDSEGLVHPFPKPLSIRPEVGSDGETVEIDPKVMGATEASAPAMIEYVVFTSYKPEGVWRPVKTTLSEGTLALIPHSIGLQARAEFSLQILEKASKNAVFLKGDRPDARDFVAILKHSLEKTGALT
jgi:hypothetical protein